MYIHMIYIYSPSKGGTTEVAIRTFFCIVIPVYFRIAGGHVPKPRCLCPVLQDPWLPGAYA